MFIKWPSIENVETAKRLGSLDWAKSFDIKGWAVSEKIDGTNISIIFHNDGTMEVGKRNSLLGDGASFYNVFGNLDKIQPLIDVMKGFVWPDEVTQITFHGEYFGSKVLNRIYYGSDYKFRFFEMSYVDDEGCVVFSPISEFRKFFDANGISDLLVPLLSITDTFEEALSYSNCGITTFRDDKHEQIMEGVVLMPYNVEPVGPNGNFMFKSKSDDFVEHASVKKIKAPKSGELIALKHINSEFKEYCTESRMYSVFSKLGKPESNKDAGKYIFEFISDARKDFFKDHDDYSYLSESDIRKISNIGSIGYNIFLTVLGNLKTDS